MPYFPRTTMPKILAPETSAEVDGSPSIINAADANVLTREIIAIERLIGAADSNARGTLMALLSKAYGILYGYGEGLIAARISGTVLPNTTIPIPSSVLSTTTYGTTLSGDTTINVTSTSGFPNSGQITKFNDTTANGASCELISYTGITPTSFTGCGRTGDAQTSTSAAVIIGGHASLCLGHSAWGAKSSANSPIGISVGHTAGLAVQATITGTPSSSFGSSLVEISYSLTVFGSYKDVSILEVLNG
jgi:hypothetical protein